MYSVTHSCSAWIFWFNRKWNCSAQFSHERFRVTPDLKVNIILNLTYESMKCMKGGTFGPNAMPGGSGKMRHFASLVLSVFRKPFSTSFLGTIFIENIRDTIRYIL